MYITPVIKGIATRIPGVKTLVARKTGGTDSARYCYAVWLRHLLMAFDNGICVPPKVVAEIGPGDSLGIGLAALISGAAKYYALDICKYANYERNINVFSELVALFGSKEDIPGEAEFPNLKPYLKSYAFPSQILTGDRLSECLQPARLQTIRTAIESANDVNARCVQYIAPWYDGAVIQEASVDMILSQAVLEHVDDLERAYESQYRWLKPNGVVSHQIDFKSHGITKEWNGHWRYPSRTWKMIHGSRPYSLNRRPHSVHLELLEKNGFRILCDVRGEQGEGIRREDLAREFREMSDDDLVCSGSFIQAMKVVCE
jgi:SAM-dependent methyltransferase